MLVFVSVRTYSVEISETKSLLYLKSERTQIAIDWHPASKECATVSVFFETNHRITSTGKGKANSIFML